MSLKRKRSSDTLSPSSTSTTSLSASPIAFQLTSPTAHAQRPFPSPHPQLPSSQPSSHLHSRTQKRHRNNRPAESNVYCPLTPLPFICIQLTNTAKTYNILYTGARFPHPSTQPPHKPNQHSDTMASSAQHESQTSLHNFWVLPSKPESIDSAGLISNDSDMERCEDCDAPLLLGTAGDVDMSGMDIDTGFTGLDEDARCMRCRRLVCETCAVVEVGVGRECLECRMR